MRATWKPLLFAALLLGLVLNACQIISGLDAVPVRPDGVDASTTRRDAGPKTDGGQGKLDDTVPSGVCVAPGGNGCPETPCCLPQDTSSETVLCVNSGCLACKLPGQTPTATVKCCSGQPPGPDGKCQGKCQESGAQCNGSDLFCCAPADPRTSASVCKSDSKCAMCKKAGSDCPDGNECCSDNGVFCKSDDKCNTCTPLDGKCGETKDCCAPAAGAPRVVCRSANAENPKTCGCVSKGGRCEFQVDCCANDKCNTLKRCGCVDLNGTCGEDNDCCRLGFGGFAQPCVKTGGSPTGVCGCKSAKGSACSKDNDCCITNGTNKCNAKKKCGCLAAGTECELDSDCCDGAGNYCNRKSKLCKRSLLNEGCEADSDCSPSSDLLCRAGDKKCCIKAGKMLPGGGQPSWCCSTEVTLEADGGPSMTCK